MFLSVLQIISNAIMTDITQSQTDELIATTLERTSRDLIDHTMMQIPLYAEFLEGDSKEVLTGGNRFRFPFIIDQMDSFQWFGPGDTFSPQPKKILAWGYSEFKQGIADIVIEDIDTWMNEGEGKLVDILNTKMKALKEHVRQSLAQTIWSDGTNAKAPTGLQGHIPSTPTTGTYMGFSRSTNYWARCWYNDGATIGPHSLTNPTNNAPSAWGSIGDIGDRYPTIIDQLNLLWASIVGNNESASSIIHVTDLQTSLWYKQIPLRCPGFDIGISEGSFNIGIGRPSFMKAPIYDDLEANGAPTGEWRTINKEYYKLYIDGPRFFKWVGPRSPYNALRRAWYLLVRFNWVNQYPRKQAIGTDIATWQA